MSLPGKSITAVGGSVLLVLVLVVFGSILAFTKNPLSLDDGLRHFVLAERYRMEGVDGPSWSDFLFEGYFTTHKVDPWFLADLSYVPFTIFENSIAGIKTATFVFLCFLIFSLLYSLRRIRMRPVLTVLILLIFFFGSETFMFRLMLGRPFVLITALLLLTVSCIVERRPIFLGILLALATLFSHLFIFPLGVAIMGSIWLFLLRERKAAFLSLGASVLGVGIGLILHPDGVLYLQWIKDIIFAIPFSKDLDLGGEVYSGLGFGDVSVFLILAVSILVVVTLALRGEFHASMKKHPEILFLGTLTGFFFLAFLLWARAIDLFWPIAVLTLAFLLGTTEGVQDDVVEGLHTPYFPFRLTAFHLITALLLMTCAGQVWRFIADDDQRSPQAFAAINVIPAHATVFNVDWDYFPVEVFLRPDLLYARGVDPTLDDPAMREILRDLTVEGVLPDAPLFSKAWWKDLRSRIDVANLGLTRVREADTDADAWLQKVRSVIDPQYLVFQRERHAEFIAKLKERGDLSLLEERGALAVFVLESGR